MPRSSACGLLAFGLRAAGVLACGGPWTAGHGLATQAPAGEPVPFGIDYRQPERYLAQGPQTQLTRADLEALAPGAWERLSSLPPGTARLAGLYAWLHGTFDAGQDGGGTGATRTARELLQGRRLASPREAVLVFAAVARLLGCPAVVVSTVGLSWAKDAAFGTKGPYPSRVFVELFADGRWILADAMTGSYVAQGYDPGNPAIPMGKGFYAMRKGADLWDCGLRTSQELQRLMDQTAARLQGAAVSPPAYAIQHWQRPAPQPLRSFALVSVNGQKVPARVSHDGLSLEVRSGVFTLGPGDTCTSRMVVVPPSGPEVTRVVAAVFTQAGPTLTMTWPGGGTTTGTLAGDTFTLTQEGMVLVYSRIATPAAEGPVRVVEGWPCREEPELDREGRLKALTLARAFQLAGTDSRLPAGSRIAFEQGQPRTCTLGAAAVIEGFPLPAGTEVYINGRSTEPGKVRPWIRRWEGCPEGATLRQEATIRGIAMPAGTRIHFRCEPTRKGEATWRCTLPAPLRIDGHLCAAGGRAVGTILYASGRLRAANVAEEEVIDGVPCTLKTRGLPFKTHFFGTDTKTWFHGNGHLEQGMVRSPCTVEGLAFKPGDIVRMTPDGRLDRAAATTLGAQSRLARNRPPPDSYRPDEAAQGPPRP